MKASTFCQPALTCYETQGQYMEDITRSTGHIKWMDLHEDEPTVQSIVKETMETQQNQTYNKLLR